MNIKPLMTFCLVADLGSLSRAAAAAGIAQSLVSRQIAQLEAQWGDRLFVRTGRGMALSDFGRRIQPEIRTLLAQFSHLETVASESAGMVSGTVHVGVLPSMSRQLLPLLFSDLRVRAPAVRLHINEGFSGELDEHMSSGRLDMAVVNRYGSSAARGEDVLGTVETYLVGKPGLPLLSGGKVMFRQLAELPLVLPATPNGLRSTLDQLSRRHGVQLDIVMEVDTSTAMKEVALSGHAFTLLPSMAVSQELLAGSLAAVPIVNPSIKRTIALSLTTQRPLSKAARLVAARVRHLATNLLVR